MRRNIVAMLLGLSLLGNAVLAIMLVQQRAEEPGVESLAGFEPATEAPPTPADTPPPPPQPTRPAPVVAANSTTSVAQVAPTSLPPTAQPEPSPTTEPTPTPEPTAEPIPSPTIVALDPDWLQYINRFRASAQLPPLRENSAWSAESGLHSRYMVLSGHVGHSQDPNSPYYTNAGNAAGDSGNIAIGHLSSAPFQWAFNYWVSAPFHAVPMLDPQLIETGFGEYRDTAGIQTVGATMDVERGRGPLPDGVQFPIFWPGNDSTTWVLRYSLPEFPAALSHCAGYTQATGAPIILQIGDGRLTPNVTATTIMRDGEPLAHCQFDETNYTHPDEWTQRSAREILNQRDAIVLIPFAPMTPDATYAVRVDANGQTYTWSFRTAAGPP